MQRALDNEMWVEVTYASSGQTVPEPSCFSIISLPTPPHPPPAQDLHACNDGCPSHLGDNEEGVEQRAPGGERAGGGLAVILVDMGKK